MQRDVGMWLDWAAPVLAIVTVPVPLISFVLTGVYLARHNPGAADTSTIFVQLVIGGFSLILLASLAVNASIICIKRFARGGRRVPRPLVPLQLGLVAAITAWLVSLASGGSPANVIGLSSITVAAFAAAVLSIFIFLFIVVPWQNRT